MAQNLEYGVRITADGTVLVGEAGRAEQALKRIGTEAEKSTASASKFGLAVGAAAAAGALAFTGLLKQTVNTAAAFDDLAESTGSTVESLSSLANSMAISGVDFGTFQTLTNKLAVGLSGVDDEGGKAAKALAALGVQSKDPATAMKELAVSLDQYADGANKAALLTAIFGRGAAQHAGVLKDLARDTEMAASVTTDFAAEAEKLEKMLARTKVSVQGFATSIASDLVSALNGAIDDLERGTAAAGGFWAALWTFGLSNPFKDITTRQAELRDELEKTNAKFLQLATDGAGEGTLGVVEDRIRKIRMELEQLNRQQLRNLNMLTGPGTYDARDLALANMNRRPDAPPMPGAGSKSKAVDYYIRGLNDIADALKREEAEQKKVLEGYREQLALMDKLYDAQANSIDAIAKETEGYQKHIDALTLTKDELYALDIAKLQAIVDARTYEGYINAETEALIKQLDTLKQLRSVESARDASEAAFEAAQRTADEWQRAADSIRDELTDAFMNAAASGRDFFKSLAASLVNMFSNLVLRPIIQGAMAPIAGGITSALYGGTASASGGGSLLSAGGSLFGGLGSFGSGASVSMGNIASLGLMEGSLANFANIGGQLSAGSIMPALGMAMPYIAAVVGIGMLVKGILDSKKGGPKSGGFASSGLIGSLSDADNGRWFTPNSADAQMRELTSSLSTSYDKVVASLGGSGRGGFALGFDTDPQGTAPNRLHAGAFVNGRQVYDAALGDLGRDQEALHAALELESKRALLAALKASDLPKQIAAVFDNVDASSSSSEAIDNLLAFGTAMKTAIDAISGSVVDDARIAWERSQRTSVDVLRDMGAEVIRLAGAMDGSAESMQALGQATSEYRSAVGATLLAIRQLGAEMTAMFSTTRDALETYGLSPEALYDRYRQDADAAMAMLASATDPESVRTLAERINADINAAFSALGDDGKSQQKDPLLEYLNGVDAFVQSKLATISASVSSSTADPFAAVNAALSNAASLFQKPADGMQGAVDKMDQVVDKMDRVVTNLGQTPLQAYVVTNEVG